MTKIIQTPLEKINGLERTVLGTLLAYPKTWGIAQRYLSPAVFRTAVGRDVAGDLWRYLGEVGPGAFSLVVFGARCKVPVSDLESLIGGCDIEVMEQACELLAEMYKEERFWESVGGLVSGRDRFANWSEAAAVIDRERADLLSLSGGGSSLADDVDKFLEDVLKGMEGGRDELVVTTGWDDIDDFFGGWMPGDQVVIGARPGMGKTRYVLQNIIRAARKGKRCALFSKELTKWQIIATAASYFSGLPVKDIRTFKLGALKYSHLVRAAEVLKGLPIVIYDRIPGPEFILSKAREEKYANGLDLFAVDYLQLLFPGGGSEDSRANELAKISAGFKGLAKELDAVSILLSQLSRAVDARTDKRPLDSDLRDSGGIEADADFTTYLYNPVKYYPDSEEPFEVIFRKTRFGVSETFFRRMSANGFLLTEEEKAEEEAMRAKNWYGEDDWKGYVKPGDLVANPGEAAPAAAGGNGSIKPSQFNDDTDIPF